MTASAKALHVERALDGLRLKAPFRISGHVFETVPVLTVTLRQGALTGEGEAAGVYYFNDLPPSMAETLDGVTADIEAGVSREDLRRLLPSGGTRNAVDCALWDLESRSANRPVWALAGLAAPKPRLTTFTVGADSPDMVAAGAKAYTHARALKLKLTGETDIDIERVRAARRARPDVWIGVDANQGFNPKTLEPLIPVLLECKVSLLEQPFRRGNESDMEGLKLPIPVAADESCQNLEELETLPGRFDVVNIKLDKCGGLTEGLLMAARAKELGLKVMVGNMVGTSLAMAPAFVLGQLCDVVDLDGPVVLVKDREPSVRYDNGEIWCPATVWGGHGDKS
jgi:L-alanine-DL-glutamate epimerase-like enolase superfamily enzyme